MNKPLIGRLLLTFVLIGGSLMSFLLDWRKNHLLNPLWHPHARYHSAILLFLFAGVSIVSTWLLWRSSREPKVAFAAAALISLAYWTPFFYVPYLLPGASYWAGIPGHEPHIAGIIVYPNLLVVTIFVVLTVIGWWFGRGALPER
jgi:hypothetical protein